MHTSSHFEMRIVSCGIRGLRTSWKPLLSLCHAGYPATASALVRLVLFLPTAQRGIVFAPSTSMRQSHTGTTSCVAGGYGSQEQGRVCMGTAQTLEHLSAREPDSGLVRVVVETPKGSRTKYK